MSDISELEDELMHAYDPVKAHEYYLRTRQLKGRNPGGPAPSSSRPSGHGGQGGAGGSSNAVLRKSRREHLDAEIKQLRAKVDALRALLEKRVAAAKKRAGVEPDPKETESKSTSSTKDSKSSKKDGKPDKPLTEKQKADKRKASKEQYDKENRTSKVHEVEALKNTIKDLRARLDKLPIPAHHEQSDDHKNKQWRSDGSDKRDGGNGR